MGRTMFSESIVGSDAFFDLGHDAGYLYFQLSMCADDDGFVGNPKSVMRMCGCSEKDLKLLIDTRYILSFPSGVVVIKHWNINNKIRPDRHKPTTYQEELGTLTIDERGAYTEKCRQKTTKCQPNDNQTSAQVRLGSLGEDSLDNKSRHKYGKYKNVLLSDDQLETLKNEFPDWQDRIERVSEYCASTGKTYKNYLATIRNWAKKDAPIIKGETSYDSEKYKEKARTQEIRYIPREEREKK